MAAKYDFFLTPQPKDKQEKVRYHARTVVDSAWTNKNHTYITTKELQYISGLSNHTALRRLKQRVTEGRMTHPGHRHSGFYFPVPGNFGISRDENTDVALHSSDNE